MNMQLSSAWHSQKLHKHPYCAHQGPVEDPAACAEEGGNHPIGLWIDVSSM